MPMAFVTESWSVVVTMPFHSKWLILWEKSFKLFVCFFFSLLHSLSNIQGSYLLSFLFLNRSYAIFLFSTRPRKLHTCHVLRITAVAVLLRKKYNRFWLKLRKMHFSGWNVCFYFRISVLFAVAKLFALWQEEKTLNFNLILWIVIATYFEIFFFNLVFFSFDFFFHGMLCILSNPYALLCYRICNQNKYKQNPILLLRHITNCNKQHM